VSLIYGHNRQSIGAFAQFALDFLSSFRPILRSHRVRTLTLIDEYVTVGCLGSGCTRICLFKVKLYIV